MKQKLPIIICGLGGVVLLCIPIYGIIQTLYEGSRFKNEDLIFLPVFSIFCISIVYTSFIAWKLSKRANFQDNEESLLSLKAKKTRLLLEKEIRELEAEKKELNNDISNKIIT